MKPLCAKAAFAPARWTPDLTTLPWAAPFGCRSQVAGVVDDDGLGAALEGLGRHQRLAAHALALPAGSGRPDDLLAATATGSFGQAEELYAGLCPAVPRQIFFFDVLAATLDGVLVTRCPAVTAPTGLLLSLPGLWAFRVLSPAARSVFAAATHDFAAPHSQSLTASLANPLSHR